MEEHSEDCKFPNAVGVESGQYRVMGGSIPAEQTMSCIKLYNQVKTKIDNWNRTKNRNIK